MTKEDKGKIKQGTIAGFMRKRTQLVGFEFGHWKHTQYAAEFADNALDAIESFQWKERKKEDSNFKFTLDKELSLENLSILQSENEIQSSESKPLDNGLKHSLLQEIRGDGPASNEIVSESSSEEQTEIISKDEVEVEEEVKNIIHNMEEIILPVESIIDYEPIVIVRIREYEAPSFLTAEISKKNIMGFAFEIFDNGTGMGRSDLKKFGKYLASSKSIQLKQTRGSQGFGAPSAFSDAQNTTGMPIIVVSKSVKNIYAMVSEFYTTSKNEKKNIVVPSEIDCPFLHGTYIKLNYLNVKYVRGYVDTYLKETALMNPHVTIVYIDPYNEEFIYPRKVSSFPTEPKYALPHPSSTNIGDLQDLITKSENHTISAFLQENFVRVSSKTAKDILNIAEKDLQEKLKFLILKNGYLNIADKRADKIYFSRLEKRIYGRSKKPRSKLIPYLVESEEIKKKYWEIILKYKQFNKDQDKIRKEIKKYSNRLDKAETKKDQKAIEKDIRKLVNNIKEIEKEKVKLKTDLDQVFKDIIDGFIEEKNEKIISDFEDLVAEVQIIKAKPTEITSEQFNSLFYAFKSIKYMSPPTDTAIPVGDTILENTLIKEIGLKISENLDNFDTPLEKLDKSIDLLIEQKKNEILKEDPKTSLESLNNITVDNDEILLLNTKILSSVDFENGGPEPDKLIQTTTPLLTYTEDDLKDKYQELYEYFLETFSKDDDFVAAETRPPTSGKGLAYVVEAVIAYSNDSKIIETPKRSRDVLSRFVNRTPKLRDSADCAITKATQSVNWKNYKLDTFDNGLPKGPIKLLVNVSGPFVHLMFKSQSKNSLADDEDLIKEIKACLEAIGRRLRVYINRRQTQRKSEKRSSLIEKHIPQFVRSVFNIASQGKSIYKDKINQKELIYLMKNAIGIKPAPVVKPPEEEISREVKVEKEEVKKEAVEIQKKKYDITDIENWTVRKLREYCKVNDIHIPERINKDDIIKQVKERISKDEEKPEIKEEEPLKKEEPPIEKPIAKKVESIKREHSEKSLKNWTVKELREYCTDHDIKLPSRPTKGVIVKKILEFYKKPVVEKPIVEKPKEPVKVAPGTIAAKREQLKISRGEPPTKPKPRPTPPKPRPLPQKTVQKTLTAITTENIVGALSNEWQHIKDLIFKFKIKDMMDARFLQLKLKELERKGQILVDIKKGKKHWRLK